MPSSLSSDQRIERFKEIAERFYESAPVDVTALAEALGIAVWEDDELPENVSGKIIEDPDNAGSSGYSIVVRASDAYVRRRFTVAHEIAHFVLHKDRIGASLTDDGMYRSNLSTWEEVQANSLAAEILMPKELILRYVRQYGPEAPLLAKFFKVSESAMQIRLRTL